MQANQLAVATQVMRGNEVVTEYGYHQISTRARCAALCHVILNPRTTADGVLRAEDVVQTILSKPRDPAYAKVQLVAIENTIGTRAGSNVDEAEIRAAADIVAEVCETPAQAGTALVERRSWASGAG
jgi:threonine aldolase